MFWNRHPILKWLCICTIPIWVIPAVALFALAFPILLLFAFMICFGYALMGLDPPKWADLGDDGYC